MNYFIELNTTECECIGGGRSDTIGGLVEGVCAGIGAFAKLLYRAHQRGMQCMMQRMAMGDQTLWK